MAHGSSDGRGQAKAQRYYKVPRTRWHYILTLTWEDRERGTQKCTATGTVSSLPEGTREDIYDFIYARTVREFEAAGEAYVLFFALEKNALQPADPNIPGRRQAAP